MLPQLVATNRGVLKFNERNNLPDDRLLRKKNHLIHELGKKQMRNAYDLDRAGFSRHRNDLGKFRWRDTQPPFNLEHLHKSVQFQLIDAKEALDDLDREYSIERSEDDLVSFSSNQILETLASLTASLSRLRAQVGLDEFKSANTLHYVVSVLKRNSRLNEFKLNLQEQKQRQKERANRAKQASSVGGANSGDFFVNSSELPATTLEGSAQDLFEILAAQSEEGIMISGSTNGESTGSGNLIQIKINGESPELLVSKSQNNTLTKSNLATAPNAGSTLNMNNASRLNVPGATSLAQPSPATESGSVHLPPIHTGSTLNLGANLNASMNRSTLLGALNQASMTAAPNPTTTTTTTNSPTQPSTTPSTTPQAAAVNPEEEEEMDDEFDEEELKRQEAEKKKAVGINLSETAKYLKKKSSSNSEDADKAVASFFMRDPSLALKRNVSLITPYIKKLKKNYVELTSEIEYDVFVLDSLLQSIIQGINQDYKQQLDHVEFLIATCEKYLQSFLFDKHKILEADLLSKETVTETDLFEERLRSNMAGFGVSRKRDKVIKITNAMNKYIESVLTYDHKRLAYIGALKSKVSCLKRIQEKFCHPDSTEGIKMDDLSEDVAELAIRFDGSRQLPCIFILPEYSISLRNCIKLLIDWLNYDQQFIDMLDTDVSMINRKRKNLMKLKLDLTMHLNQLSYRIKLLRGNMEQKEKEVNDFYRQNEVKLVTQKLDFSEKRLLQKKNKEMLDHLEAKLSGYLQGARSEQDRLKEKKKDGHHAGPHHGEDGFKCIVENINLNLQYIEETQMPNINKDLHNNAKINMCYIEFKQRQYEILRSNLTEIERNHIGTKLKSFANSFDQELYLLDNCFYLLKEIYIHKTCADTLTKLHFGLDLPNLKFNSLQASLQSTDPAQEKVISLSEKKKLIDPEELKEMTSKPENTETYLNRMIDVKTKRTLINSIELSRSKISSNNKFLTELMDLEKDIGTILPKIPNQLEAAFYLISNLIENDWIRYYHSLPFHPIRGSENKNQDVQEAMNRFLRDNSTQTKALFLLRKWNRLNMRAKLEDLKSTLKTINRQDILKILNIYLEIHTKLFKRDEEDLQAQQPNMDPKRREAEQLHQKLVKLFDKIKKGEFDASRVHGSFNSGATASPKRSVDKKSSLHKESMSMHRKSLLKS